MVIFQHKIGNMANSFGSRHLAACFLVITCLFSQSAIADTAATDKATASNKHKTKQILPKDAMIELGKGEKPGLKASGDTALSQSAIAIMNSATVEVTASNTNKYKTEQILPKDAMIELGKGEELGLKASASGGIAAEYSVQGPYSDKQAKQKGLPGLIETLIDLATLHDHRFNFNLLTNPNYLDLSRSAGFGFCYPAAAATSITLWRNDALDSGILRLSIEKSGSEKSVAQHWPERENTLAWPRKLPVINGANYLAELDGRPMMIILRQLPSEELPSNVYKASRMVEKGCFRQARLLLSAGGH